MVGLWVLIYFLLYMYFRLIRILALSGQLCLHTALPVLCGFELLAGSGHLGTLRATLVERPVFFKRQKKKPPPSSLIGWEGPYSRQETVGAERCVEKASAF